MWSIACLDVSARSEAAFEKLGNILGFVAAYLLGPDPDGRGVPPELVPAVRELRATYTTRQREMDPTLVKRQNSYDEMAALFPLLEHLQPPAHISPGRISTKHASRRRHDGVRRACDPIRSGRGGASYPRQPRTGSSRHTRPRGHRGA